MYLKKMLTIIIVFITSLICFSLICSIFLNLGTGGQGTRPVISENFFKLPLYIIGYGETPSISRYGQLLLCISGLIMVNFLNAFLTVALFRFRHVKVKPGFKKDEETGDFIASFEIINKGKQIFNVSLLIQAYEEGQDGEIDEIGQLRFERKILNRKGTWAINQRLQVGDLLYNFFRSQNKSGAVKLQTFLEYLDNETGNQILTAKEYTINDFIPERDRRSEERHSLRNEINRFFSLDYKQIELSRAKRVVENNDDSVMKILDAEKSSITFQLDFSNKENYNPPEFVMALIDNVPGEDWSIFYKMNYRLDFDICSSMSIHAVQLEIKSDCGKNLEKVIDKKVYTFKGYKHYSLGLQDTASNPAFLKSVKEICFTCFLNDTDRRKGELKIKDLRLVAGEAAKEAS